MPFLCRLGFHRPEPGDVWNNGFFFTRCMRCGADIVRTASGKWHVPKDKRVVWRPRIRRGRRRG